MPCLVVGGEDSTKVVRVARTQERQCLVERDNTGLCGEGGDMDYLIFRCPAFIIFLCRRDQQPVHQPGQAGQGGEGGGGGQDGGADQPHPDTSV